MQQYKHNLHNKNLHTSIKLLAKNLGFDYCGIAKAEELSEDARRLETWLQKGMQGNMQYMENHFEKRINPTLLVEGAKSVITVLKNYYPSQHQNIKTPKISKYAYGQDYHTIIKEQLNVLYDEMKKVVGDFNGRGFVDSAPVLERSWAVKTGAGWIGKNGNLITKQGGSFFFLATLIVDVELEYDPPFVKDFCGTCTKCIDTCPTQAILPNKVVDGSKCISYYTIELKEMMAKENIAGNLDGWMFGCDACQDVCPWSRFSKPHAEPGFTPLPQVLNFTTAQWEELTEESFKNIFKTSPLKRSKWAGIKRNLGWLKES